MFLKVKPHLLADSFKSKMHFLFEMSIFHLNTIIKFISKSSFRKDAIKRYYNGIGNDPISQIQHRERKVSFGDKNPDKTFYVIRRFSLVEGHYSMVSSILGHLTAIEGKKYIPIVDMKNYYSRLWQPIEFKGKENAWEYFYDQVSDYSLEEVYQSKNVILSWGGKVTPIWYKTIDFNNIFSIQWGDIYEKYIHLNPHTKQKVNMLVDQYNFGNHRILGVSIRRDHEFIIKNNIIGLMPASHPCKTIEDRIACVAKLMLKWNCDRVFLSIDEQEGLELFKNVFGGKLFYIDRYRPRYFRDGKVISEAEVRLTNNELWHEKENPKETIYQREIRYIAELQILALSNSLLGSRCTATLMSLLFNKNRYENVYMYNGDDILVDQKTGQVLSDFSIGG